VLSGLSVASRTFHLRKPFGFIQGDARFRGAAVNSVLSIFIDPNGVARLGPSRLATAVLIDLEVSSTIAMTSFS
jgi:hypothetical protein